MQREWKGEREREREDERERKEMKYDKNCAVIK